MRELFSTLLRMSGSASIVILAVLLVRLFLRRAPKIFAHALWAVVLFRLLCPVTMESAMSLIPSARLVSFDVAGGGTAQIIQVETGLSAVDGTVNNFLLVHPYRSNTVNWPIVLDDEGNQVQPPIQQTGNDHWNEILPMIWLAGVTILFLYSTVSLLVLRRRLVGAVPLEGESGVWLADHIETPFVLGLFRPKIYIPSDLPGQELDYILLHERTHIRRFDHLFRVLAWLAVTIHWFNPLAWLAFHLAGKDVEMSCDEAVLRRMGRDVRAEYSSSLLRLSIGKRLQAGPLAFGSGNPQDRIKNVLSYKKPALWVVTAALIAVLAAGVALATDRMPAPESPFGCGYWATATESSSHSAPSQVQLDTSGLLRICSVDGIWKEIGVLDETELDQWIFLRYLDGLRAGRLRRGNYAAWQFVLEDEGDLLHNGEFWCLLQQKDGSLYLAAGWYDPDRKDWPGVEDSTVYWVVRLKRDETPTDVRYSLNSNGNMFGSGDIFISGYDCDYMQFSQPENPSYSTILWVGNPRFLHPFFERCHWDLAASWADERQTMLRVSFGTEIDIVFATPQNFIADLTTGTITVERQDTAPFSDEEMLTMARTFADIMRGAEEWYEAQAERDSNEGTDILDFIMNGFLKSGRDYAPDQNAVRSRLNEGQWVYQNGGNIAVIVPESPVKIMLSHDGGQTWKESIVYGSDEMEIYGELRHNIPYLGGFIGFFGESYGYLVLTTAVSMNNQPMRIYLTDDGGSTWYEIGNPYRKRASVLTGACFSTPEIGFVSYRYYEDAGPDIWWTADGGNTWQKLLVTLPEEYTSKEYCFTPQTPTFNGKDGIYPIAFHGKGEVEGTIYMYTHDYGLTWEFEQ